jgi:glycosyltransferase involved in cell wall biosynthesis
MNYLSIEAPVNSLSFGNCTFNILKSLFKRGQKTLLAPIGERIDVSSFDSLDIEFSNWIENSIKSFNSLHSRENPSFKLWHINGSLSSISNKANLFTFYELDEPTKNELNILKNQSKVFVSSSFTKKVFENNGIENVVFCPLGFDNDSFKNTGKKYHDGEKIVFGLVGKLEKRKQHHKVLSAWAKKYGNNPKYMLNCSIKNPFIDESSQMEAIKNILGGVHYFNINFLNFMPKNSEYNDYLNSNDIIIGMSAGEGWGLPEFQSLCLGKHGVILNAHAYRDWANSENAVLVESTSKIECYDGIFFHKGHEFNQGKYFDWNEESFISACEEAEKRFESDPVNKKGEELKEKFTWDNTTDIILENLSN